MKDDLAAIWFTTEPGRLFAGFDLAELKVKQTFVPAPVITGGTTSVKHKFAIRFHGNRVPGTLDEVQTPELMQDRWVMQTDVRDFSRSNTLNYATLYNTADDAARAIAARNAFHGGAHVYSIVPITVTETSEKFETTTKVIKGLPPKDVYRVHNITAGKDVRFSNGNSFSWSMNEEPTDFPSPRAAFEAIHKRDAFWGQPHNAQWSVVERKIPGTKTTTDITVKLIAPRTVTRSV